MARGKKSKWEKRLKARQAAYLPTGPSPKHTAHRPGSQKK